MITPRRCVDAAPAALPTARPFSDLIASHLTRRKWRRPDLKRRLIDLGHGYSTTLVWYWSSGERMPRLRSVMHLAAAFDWSATERLAAFDTHAEQWGGGPAHQIAAIATRFGWPDLARLDAYDTAATSDVGSA
jgi:hypothetical protein